MNTQKNFTRCAAVCCFLSVITTLGIHLYFPDPPADFEQRVKLYQDTTYMINRWWVIVHCLLVVISMWGFSLLQMKRSAGLAGLGFLFIAVFAIAEITRQMIVLFYINELREQYVMATDPLIRESLKANIINGGLLTAPLFGLFILVFGLGNLCYGFSLWGEKKLGKLLSLLLMAWGLGTLTAFGNHFWESAAISSFIETYNYTFQPFVRAMIGLWLWKKSSAM